MKKKLLLIILLLSVFVLPFKVSARDFSVAGKKYVTNDFLGTLKDEGITPKVEDYKESEDKINIYLFYGKGCEHCDNFLNFLNDISPEYAQYFNIISFEIYGDANNSTLLKTLATSINESDDGVPFMFIGDQYYNGYATEYDESIKEAIKTTYDTPKAERTDIIKAFEKEMGYTNKTSSGTSETTKIVLFNLLFTAISTIVIIVFINIKINSITDKKKK